MSKQLLFTQKGASSKKVQCFIKAYDLRLVYEDKYKIVFENNKMMASLTKGLLSILLFNQNDVKLEIDIKKYFYGDKYGQFKITI